MCFSSQVLLPATSADTVSAFDKRTKQVYEEQVGFSTAWVTRAKAEVEELSRATSKTGVAGVSTPAACRPLAVLKVPLQFSAAVNLTQQMENVDEKKLWSTVRLYGKAWE